MRNGAAPMEIQTNSSSVRLESNSAPDRPTLCDRDDEEVQPLMGASYRAYVLERPVFTTQFPLEREYDRKLAQVALEGVRS